MRSQMLFRWVAGAMVGMALVALSLVFPVAVFADITPAGSRNGAPDFSLTDAKGARVRLADYKGKVVLLDFWATWCTGCKVEIPWYIEFQQKYKSKGLASIGVAMDGSPGAAHEDQDYPWHDPALAINDRMKLAEGKPKPLQLMAATAQLDCGTCGYPCKTYSEAIASGS